MHKKLSFQTKPALDHAVSLCNWVSTRNSRNPAANEILTLETKWFFFLDICIEYSLAAKRPACMKMKQAIEWTIRRKQEYGAYPELESIKAYKIYFDFDSRICENSPACKNLTIKIRIFDSPKFSDAICFRMLAWLKIVAWNEKTSDEQLLRN